MAGDLGLLHLTDALIFGDSVKAAILPQKEFNPTGMYAFLGSLNCVSFESFPYFGFC